MSRADWLKLGYLAVLGSGAVAVGVFAYWMKGEHLAMFAVAAVLLIPGRVQGYYYRDLFRGRRLLEAGQPDASRSSL